MTRHLLFLAMMLIPGNGSQLAAQVTGPTGTEKLQNINWMLDAMTFPHFDSLRIVATIDSIARQGNEEITEYARYFNLHHQAYLIQDAEARLQRLVDISSLIASYKTNGIKALHKFRLGDFFFQPKKIYPGP